MNKKTLSWIILFVCLSMAGVIVVQYLWIRNAVEIKEAQFDRSVNDALGVVVNTLETRENMTFLSRNLIRDSIRTVIQAFAKDSTLSLSPKIDTQIFAEDHLPPPPLPQQSVHQKKRRIGNPVSFEIIARENEKERIFMDSIMRSMGVYSINPDFFTFNVEFNWSQQDLEKFDSIAMVQEPDVLSPPVGYQISKDGSTRGEIIIHRPDRSLHQFYRYNTPQEFSPPDITDIQQDMTRSRKLMQERMKTLTVKAKNLQNLIKKMAIELETDARPLATRIDKEKLEKSIKTSLADKNITFPFEYAIQAPENDTIPFPITSKGFSVHYPGTPYKISLFPNDVFQKSGFLLVYFPDKKSHLLNSLSLVMIGSMFFTFFIILSSLLSIFVMIRQKKISDIKTDFINNMTHEFKTPIATISIAADSINNPRVLQEPDTIRNFTRIIKEENYRMNSRVEQVLQMALLDSKDFKLKPVAVGMHNLIEKAVEHFRLQIERREGTITTTLLAGDTIVEADEDHMRNVLMNLLDNANKYSVAKPVIHVFSFNRGGKFYFGVEDQGIGMNPETQRKVFDKFFRVTAGNIHQIKGFGLGLSYVRAIVLAHQGSIQVFSEVGKGSRFEIMLPPAKKNTNHE